MTMMRLLEAIKEASERRGLLLNTKKIKIMIIDDTRNDDGEGFTLDGNIIEEVQSFDFLGSLINNEGDCTGD